MSSLVPLIYAVETHPRIQLTCHHAPMLDGLALSSLSPAPTPFLLLNASPPDRWKISAALADNALLYVPCRRFCTAAVCVLLCVCTLNKKWPDFRPEGRATEGRMVHYCNESSLISLRWNNKCWFHVTFGLRPAQLTGLKQVWFTWMMHSGNTAESIFIQSDLAQM